MNSHQNESIENKRKTEPNVKLLHSRSDISIDTYDESLKWDSDGDVNPNHQIAEMTPDKAFCRVSNISIL